MAKFEIRRLVKNEYDLWDDFVDNSPQGTLFHKTYWLKATGKKFSIYGCFKGNEFYAGIPVCYDQIIGCKYFSPPLQTPYLGILMKHQDAKYVKSITREKKISSELIQWLKGEFYSIKFNYTPGMVDLQPFIWEGFTCNVRYTYIINLNNSLEDIWKSMDDTRRRNISKAKKDGINVSSNYDLQEVFSLVEKTFDRQDMKVPFKTVVFNYIYALKERNKCISFLSKNENGDNIAVVYLVWDNKRSYYLMGGYDSEKSHYGASAVAMWKAIKFSKEELGLAEFDFEGSMVPQIEQFFRKFGGILTPYYSVVWEKPFPISVRMRAVIKNLLRK